VLLTDKRKPLVRLAKKRLREEWLHRWWCKKYNLPRTDPRYGEYTPEELLLEFYEDLWEKDPNEARGLLGGLEDDVVLETGDEELDEVERRLAAGEDPDVVLKDWGNVDVPAKKAAAPVVEEFDDDFTKDAGTSFTRR
jgi:hypothetical protein